VPRPPTILEALVPRCSTDLSRGYTVFRVQVQRLGCLIQGEGFRERPSNLSSPAAPPKICEAAVPSAGIGSMGYRVKGLGLGLAMHDLG
jgi:hypothetical protein